jgi:hypothetical protein
MKLPFGFFSIADNSSQQCNDNLQHKAIID